MLFQPLSYDQHLTHCILRARGDPVLVSQSDPVVSFMTAWRQPNQQNINVWTRLNQFCSKFCSHGNDISRNLAAGTMVDLSSWYEGMDQSDANINAQAICFDFIHSSTSTFKMEGCCTSQLMWGPRNFGGTGIVDKFWDAAVVLDVFQSCSQNHILSASTHGSVEILDVELSYGLAFPLRYVCLGYVGYVMLHDNLPLNFKPLANLSLLSTWDQRCLTWMHQLPGTRDSLKNGLFLIYVMQIESFLWAFYFGGGCDFGNPWYHFACDCAYLA